MPIPTTPAAAANAYAVLGRLGEETAKFAPIGDAPAAGPSFGSVLKDVINAVSESGAKADTQAQAVAMGKANMVDVVTAVAESETAIATLVSVRDKVISAYEDILKMPI
ncbi:MAG: flagellar hook-basal body complex protein FliE [Xanthobacteraceae bacterium]|jgi:flagellar hook-basal body complex protein FliE